MIGLTPLISKFAATFISTGYAQTLWNGRSVQKLLQPPIRAFSDYFDGKKTTRPYPLPQGKASSPPDYLKRGGPIELSMRSELRNDDPRTEEEREQEFWDRVKRMSAKGLILTAEQAVKVYPDSPYFKEKDN